MRYLIFSLGSKLLALSGDKVQEVIKLALLGPAPGKVYMGSVPWRGKVIAILRPEALGAENANPGFAVVTDVSGIPVGFPADRAISITDAETKEPAPPGSEEWLSGMIGKQRAWVIDADRVITKPELGEAALALGEEEFLRFCAFQLSVIAERRGSKRLRRLALELEKELKGK
ncbi:MAG: chemotaxis protein CheW [candidate division WOR-3 bacterium]